MAPPRGSLRAPAPLGLAKTELVRAKTIDEVCSLLANAAIGKHAAMVLAGGTDFIVDRHLAPVEKVKPLDLVVDVTGVDELGTIRFHSAAGEARLELGGGVTYWALREDARIAKEIPMLAAMAKDVGAVQIQTRGTLAGNIASASPAADGVPALMALGGVVKTRSVRGSREVPLDAFFTGYRKTVLAPDEIVASIDVRVPHAGSIAKWRKVGTRLAQAISKVALASVIDVNPDGVVTQARFGMASVAAVTAPLTGVRAFVEGKKLREIDRAALDEAVGREIKPIDDVRSTGAYRLHVAKALVRRALEA